MNNEFRNVFRNYLPDLNLKFGTWEFKKVTPVLYLFLSLGLAEKFHSQEGLPMSGISD
jgi:hypothetical protein